MTIHERLLLRKALRILIVEDDGDFTEAIRIIARLAEMRYPAAEAMATLKRADLKKLEAGPNQQFKATEYRKRRGTT